MLKRFAAPASVLACALLPLPAATASAATTKAASKPSPCLTRAPSAQPKWCVGWLKKRAERLATKNQPAAIPTPAPVPQPDTSVVPAGALDGHPVTLKFAPGNIWTTPVPADAPLDASSAARVAALASAITAREALGHTPSMGTTNYSTPIYVVGHDVPRVPVILDTGAWGDPFRQALSSGVPIPVNAIPAGGTDAHLVIYQPSTDSLWEFWRARLATDGWHAAWGGATNNLSNMPGFYTTSAWGDASAVQGWDWGASASSTIGGAGVILPSEIASGEIDHAIGMAIGQACSYMFALPAQRHDGQDTSANCMPEGARLRLDPTLDLDAMHLPKMTLLLARAAQRYGIIVHDTTGDTIQMAAEDMTWTGSNPYIGPTGLFGGDAPWKFMTAFPWSHLQLLPMSLCTTSPCTAPAAPQIAAPSKSARRAGHVRRVKHVRKTSRGRHGRR